MIGRSVAKKIWDRALALKRDNQMTEAIFLEAIGQIVDGEFASYLEKPSVGKLSAERRSALFDAMIASCKYNPSEITRTKGAEIGTAIKDILLVTPEVTPAEIKRRAEAYHRKHPTWELTPGAIAKWWADIGPAKKEIDVYQEPPEGWRNVLVSIAGEEYRDRPWSDVRSVYGRRIWQAMAEFS